MTPKVGTHPRPPVSEPHWPPCCPQVVLKNKDDQVTVIGAGVTLHEALAAADLLKRGKEGGTRNPPTWLHDTPSPASPTPHTQKAVAGREAFSHFLIALGFTRSGI